MKTFFAASSRTLSALLLAAGLTLAGCSAGSLTGPEEVPLQPAAEVGSVNQDASHNELSNRGDSGGTSTTPISEHNELPDGE